MNLMDLAYNFPSAANLLFFVPLFLLLFWLLYQHRQKILGQYAPEDKLKSLLIFQSGGNFWLKVLGIILVWIGLSLSLMQPKGNARYPASVAKAQQISSKAMRLLPHEVIFMIDASASMSTLDGRLAQSRLQNAQEIADQVMSKLRGQSASLYTFTSDIAKLSPPSMDYLFMRLMLRSIAIDEGDASGTDIKTALKYFQEHYLNPSTPLIKTLILISDGEDNQFEELQNERRDAYIQDVVALLGNSETAKLHVYTIGVGTKRGAEIPKLTFEGHSVTSHLVSALLESLSQKGNGRYYASSDYAAVDIATDLIDKIIKADQFAPVDLNEGTNPEEDLIYDLYFQVPLGIAILLFILYLFWPDTFFLQKNLIIRGMIGFLLLPLAGYGAETRDDKLRLAGAYYDAKAYPQASNIYEELLNEDLTSWERSVILYNLGTLSTAEGHYEKSIENFQKIPLGANTSPLLETRLRRNLALANFRQGLFLQKSINAASSVSQDPYFKLLYFYKQALEGTQSAYKAHCHLFQMMGEDHCPANINLQNIENLSKNSIALMRTEARNNLVSNANLQQGLPWLLTGLQLMIRDSHFLLEKQLPDNLKTEYRNFFRKNAESWMPLWKAMQTKISNKDERDGFEKAKKKYELFLQSMNKEDINVAQKYLKVSMQELENLMHTVFAKDSFHEVISKLFNDFSLATLQDPLEINTLLFLQKEMSEITIPEAHQVLKAGIIAIKDNLDHSLLLSEKRQFLISQMYFQEALQQLRRILLLLNPTVLESPDIILEAGIQEQSHALMQTRVYANILEQQKNKTPDVAATFVRNSQEYLIKFSEFFYLSAYTAQTKEFNGASKEQGKDLRCQYSPWNEVFPLFQDGTTAAGKAVTFLKDSEMKLSAAMHEQEHVIELWNQALKKMKEPKKESGCHSSPLSNQPNQKDQHAGSFEDLSRLIQQMNQEDQKPKRPASTVKKGLLPW